MIRRGVLLTAVALLALAACTSASDQPVAVVGQAGVQPATTTTVTTAPAPATSTTAKPTAAAVAVSRSSTVVRSDSGGVTIVNEGSASVNTGGNTVIGPPSATVVNGPATAVGNVSRP
ncbi:MAG: hypothetical protein M3163_14530 [Actinomycetota bacterium]|nr:hypothetical protein [Actinomycetota bacterium]